MHLIHPEHPPAECRPNLPTTRLTRPLGGSLFDRRLDHFSAGAITALVESLLSRDDSAWTELVRRYGPVLRHQLRKTTRRAMKRVLTSDAIEDILQDFYLSLVDDEMHKVRVWAEGPRRARFGSWLALLATQEAFNHIRKAFRRSASVVQVGEIVDPAESDSNRGGEWIGKAREAHITDAKPGATKPRRRRRRKARR